MSKLTYRDAGVDIAAGNALVDRIKPAVAATKRAGVMDGLGGFGAFFDLARAGHGDSVLVAATDGVGTKLRLAIDTGLLDTVGTDLVAMCVNDLICQGAEPLFFLDYFATGALDVDSAARVISGIADGCRGANVALVGGETAEMPGMYQDGDFDLAGFAVGAVQRGAELPRGVAAGDVLIGLASDGVHSNGFSLVRKTIVHAGLGLDAPAPFDPTQTLGAALMTPTRLYVKPVLGTMAAGGVHAAAHITGGGLTENLPRVVPADLGLRVDLDSWDLPPLFDWLLSAANLDPAEALVTYNCGIGMVLIVDPDSADAVLASLDHAGERACVIGAVTDTPGVSYIGTLNGPAA